MSQNYQNFSSLSVNLNRQKNGPLDISQVFTSQVDMEWYASGGTVGTPSSYWTNIVPRPYSSQFVALVGWDTNNSKATVQFYYFVENSQGTFDIEEFKLNSDEAIQAVLDKIVASYVEGTDYITEENENKISSVNFTAEYIESVKNELNTKIDELFTDSTISSTNYLVLPEGDYINVGDPVRAYTGVREYYKSSPPEFSSSSMPRVIPRSSFSLLVKDSSGEYGIRYMSYSSPEPGNEDISTKKLVQGIADPGVTAVAIVRDTNGIGDITVSDTAYEYCYTFKEPISLSNGLHILYTSKVNIVDTISGNNYYEEVVSLISIFDDLYQVFDNDHMSNIKVPKDTYYLLLGSDSPFNMDVVRDIVVSTHNGKSISDYNPNIDYISSLEGSNLTTAKFVQEYMDHVLGQIASALAVEEITES